MTILSETDALARSNNNASAAVTARDGSPAFTGFPPRGELARPSTDTTEVEPTMVETSQSIGKKPARRERCVAMRYCYRTRETSTGRRRDETPPRNCEWSTATRHRGDAPTSPQQNRFPDPAEAWCDEPLPARTPRGSHHAREKPHYDSGVLASETINRGAHRWGERHHLPNKTLRPCPSMRTPTLGRTPWLPPNKTLRPRPSATWLTAWFRSRGTVTVPRAPTEEVAHRSSVHPNRSLPDVATGKTPPHRSGEATVKGSRFG